MRPDVRGRERGFRSATKRLASTVQVTAPEGARQRILAPRFWKTATSLGIWWGFAGIRDRGAGSAGFAGLGLELVIRAQTVAGVRQSPLGRTGRAEVQMTRQTDALGE